jgi:hypothetical protein
MKKRTRELKVQLVNKREEGKEIEERMRRREEKEMLK